MGVCLRLCVCECVFVFPGLRVPDPTAMAAWFLSVSSGSGVNTPTFPSSLLLLIQSRHRAEF